MVLESFDDLRADKPTLREDTIIIEVTNYLRADPLEPFIVVDEPYKLITLGETLVFSVPHCYTEEPITPTLDINLIQDD